MLHRTLLPLREIAGPDNTVSSTCHRLDKAETIFSKWARERRPWLTGPKVKTKAEFEGAGRSNQKPFKTRPFHSHDDLTSCCAGPMEWPVMLLLRAERPAWGPWRKRRAVLRCGGDERRNIQRQRMQTRIHMWAHSSPRDRTGVWEGIE